MARRRGQRKGHLYQKSGWWMLRYRVDTPEGRKRIAIPILRCADGGKREAQRVAWEEVLSRLDTAAIRPSSSRSLREFFEQRFEPDVVATLKISGQIHYRHQFHKHVLPTLGAVSLRDVTPARVQDLINAKLAEKLSVQSVAHIKKALGACLRHAKRMGWFFGELPTEAVRLPEMTREERHALTWDQVVMIAKALPEPVSTLTILLTLAGLRIGEAVGLRRKWLNLTENSIICGDQVIPPMSLAVRESFVRGQWQSVKSAKSRRNIPIPEWFAPHLLRHLSQSKFQSPEDPVFVARNGSPLDEHNTAARVLKPTVRKLGLQWVSWHTFRHTQATLADQAGATVTQRQRILGHAAEAITMHYTHADLDQVRPILEAMVDPKKLQ